MQETTVDSLRLPLSRAILGTMTFGDTCSPEKSLELLAIALDSGITMIDTANVYSAGKAEEIIAPFYAKRSDKVMIATKVGIPHNAMAMGLAKPVLAQQMYSLIARKIEDEFIEYSQTSGTKLVSYNPLGGGLLASRYSFTSNPDEGRFGNSVLAQMYKSRYWNKETFDVLDRLSEIATQNSMTLVELSLRWLISKPGVTSILLGASKAGNLTESCNYITQEGLADFIVQECEDVSAYLNGISPKYNR